jgi:thymidylate synthase
VERLVPDLIDGYVDVVNMVCRHGQLATPRGLATREILGAQIIVDNPRYTLPLGTGRGVSKSVAAVETLQLIGGFTDPVLTTKASDAFEKVKDGGAFHGAYGPRAAMQFPKVVERLKRDRYGRRAVVTIWDPMHDMFREELHDYPCTVSLEYMIRNDRLVAITHMRSNDVWLGLAYDAFVFTQVQLTLAAILEVDVGRYIHHASSLHLYESDLEKVDQLHTAALYPELPSGLVAISWQDAQRVAQAIVYGDNRSARGPRWYHDAMREIRGPAVMG